MVVLPRDPFLTDPVFQHPIVCNRDRFFPNRQRALDRLLTRHQDDGFYSSTSFIAFRETEC